MIRSDRIPAILEPAGCPARRRLLAHGLRCHSHMTWFWTFLRGALAGAAGTWAMDGVTTWVEKRQSKPDAAREKAARPNAQHSVENLVDTAAASLGIRLNARARPVAIQLTHYGLGVGPGAVSHSCATASPCSVPVEAWRTAWCCSRSTMSS